MTSRKEPEFFGVQIKVLTVAEQPPIAAFDSSYQPIDSPDEILELWRRLIAPAPWYDAEKEHCVCFCLDTRYKLKAYSLVSIGCLNETVVHPREVFRPAVACAAHSVIVAHNHPSGNPSPSGGDITMTQRLYQAGELLRIPLLDFVIIGREKSLCSMHGKSLLVEPPAPTEPKRKKRKPARALKRSRPVTKKVKSQLDSGKVKVIWQYTRVGVGVGIVEQHELFVTLRSDGRVDSFEERNKVTRKCPRADLR